MRELRDVTSNGQSRKICGRGLVSPNEILSLRMIDASEFEQSGPLRQ